MTLDTAFDRARAIADAVLREGQVLFPYRASALKNQFRWLWGVLAPPEWVARTGSDRSSAAVECVADVRAGATLGVRLRFVHLAARRTESPPADGASPDWDEAVEQYVDITDVPLAAGTSMVRDFELPASVAVEAIGEHTRVRRTREQVSGRVTVAVDGVDAPWSLVRVRVTVENTTVAPELPADRPEALRRSLVAVHVVLAAADARFVSPVDPPEFARAAVLGCRSDGLWPARIGGADDLLLGTPVVLPDGVTVAAPSPGDTCDGTEIDELLALAVHGLTDDERREAAATDPIAAAIIARLAGAAPDLLGPLHAEMQPELVSPYRPGDLVRLDPAPGADAQDAFVAGRLARVEDVLHDVDGRVHVAVTLDGDPAADLLREQRRYRYFDPAELHPAGNG